MPDQVNIFWFRRDLRLDDNAGLYYALKDENPVLPIFIFDRSILDELEDKEDKRITFIHEALLQLQEQLVKRGSSLDVRYGFPQDVFKDLLKEYSIAKVFTNRDYEPYAQKRDQEVAALLKKSGAVLLTCKDQVIFEKSEVQKDDGKPYTIFTPYSRKWKALLNAFYLKPYPTKKYFKNFYQQKPVAIPSIQSIGFIKTGTDFPTSEVAEDKIKKYDKQRDIPSIAGTTRLSVHLRFGTISIRKLTAEAQQLNEVFLNELIWRDFYQCFSGISRKWFINHLNPITIKSIGAIMTRSLKPGVMETQVTRL